MMNDKFDGEDKRFFEPMKECDYHKNTSSDDLARHERFDKISISSHWIGVRCIVETRMNDVDRCQPGSENAAIGSKGIGPMEACNKMLRLNDNGLVPQ